LLVFGVHPNNNAKFVLGIGPRLGSKGSHLLSRLAIARYETPAAWAILAVGTPMLLRAAAVAVKSRLALANGESEGVRAR